MINQEPVEQSLAELLAIQEYLKHMIRMMTSDRNSLPRNDKETAHRLLAQINQFMAEEKRLRPKIARAREAEEKREQHSLWCACIIELYGQEDLALCFEWMKQERKKRKSAQIIAQDAIAKAEGEKQ